MPVHLHAPARPASEQAGFLPQPVPEFPIQKRTLDLAQRLFGFDRVLFFLLPLAIEAPSAQHVQGLSTGVEMRLLALFLIAINTAIFADSTPSSAASILPSDKDECAIDLTGPIVEGDFGAFLEIAHQLGLDGQLDNGELINSPQNAVCLDSSGGLMLEGALMARFIHDYGITTRIEAFAECYSACALIFMAGHAKGPEIEYTNRILDVRGSLGFHAPFVAVEADESMTGAEVMAIQESLRSIMAMQVEFGLYRSPFGMQAMVPASLISALLQRGPDEVEYVDTVEEAARWDIGLAGIIPRVKLSHTDRAVACLNFQAWVRDSASDLQQLEYYRDQSPSISRLGPDGYSHLYDQINTGGMEAQFCLVGANNEAVSSIPICVVDDFSGVRYGSCENGRPVWIPWWYAADPQMPIARLAGSEPG
ncbi:hypothetical protein [Martelella sp. FOR1707]